MPNKNKATHEGHCQLCGHLQKLPCGTLARHGYQVRWNCFVGICPGSLGRPYETSKDLIEAAIVQTDNQIRNLQAEIAKTLANQGPEVLVRDFNQKGKPWVKKTLKLDGGTGTPQQMRYGVRSDEALVRYHNEAYARHLGDRVSQLQLYRAWLEARESSWVPAELKPVQ